MTFFYAISPLYVLSARTSITLSYRASGIFPPKRQLFEFEHANGNTTNFESAKIFGMGGYVIMLINSLDCYHSPNQ